MLKIECLAKVLKNVFLTALTLSVFCMLSQSKLVQAQTLNPEDFSEYKDYDVILSNSQDWRDVYSVMLLAGLTGKTGRFLTSTRHGRIILPSIAKTNNILIVTSKKNPWVVGYKSVFEANGYEHVDEKFYDNANLELARSLQVKKFIVIDDAYGYNSIAVAPVAVAGGYWVLFANKRNINRVERFLKTKNVEEVIIYGHVDRQVLKALKQYDPEIIDEGDRFDNNIKIVEKFLELKPDTKQVVLTNGEFIEVTFFTGHDPVLFIGRTNVPDQIRSFIRDSPFVAAVLVGNELIGVATFIRRQIGISVFVKFAQSARIPAGAISPVEDLDRYWLPRYVLNLTIHNVAYNKVTKSLEVTYHNPASVAEYFKTTINIPTREGNIVVGDEEPVFIDKGDYKTISYEMPRPLEGENLTAKIQTLYGEGKRSLEFMLETTFKINFIEVNDQSLINITSLVYSKRKKAFIVTLENLGRADAYADVEILDLWVNGEYITISAPELSFVKAKHKTRVEIPIKLSQEDIDMNQLVKVKAYYGERETALIKVAYAEFAFAFEKPNYLLYIAIIIIAVLLLLLIISKRRKKVCKHCGYKNPASAKYCRKCGEKL